MAGTILIAMLIVGVGVYLAINFSQTSDTYYKRWNTEQVQQYNEQITRNNDAIEKPYGLSRKL